MAKPKKSRKSDGAEPKPDPVRIDLAAGEATRAYSIQSEMNSAMAMYQQSQAMLDGLVAGVLDDRGLDKITYACGVRIEQHKNGKTVTLVIEAA